MALLPCLVEVAKAAKVKKNRVVDAEPAEKDANAGIPERYRDDPRFRVKKDIVPSWRDAYGEHERGSKG